MLASFPDDSVQFNNSFVATVIAFLIASSSATAVNSLASVAALCLLSENNNTFQNVASFPPKKFNLSIIIKDGGYDVSPYLKIK